MADVIAVIELAAVAGSGIGLAMILMLVAIRVNIWIRDTYGREL